MSVIGRYKESYDRKSEQYRKLFIGGLSPLTDDNELRSFYSQWGQLVDCVVMKDNETGRSRGFGFITYKDPEMVDNAQSHRPHEIRGKTVESKRAMPREDSNSPEAHMTVNKLFVGRLKRDITSEQIKDHFSAYGNVIDCELGTDKNSGQSRGFAFVTFDDYDPVDKAILYKPHIIKECYVDVKKALSKEQMQSIKSKHAAQMGMYNAFGNCSNVGFFSHSYGHNTSYGHDRNNFHPVKPEYNRGYGGMGDGYDQYAFQNYINNTLRGPMTTYNRNPSYTQGN